ncbi:putative reverse transcriptase domain-containing protein [Tanacetum coccineum]
MVETLRVIRDMRRKMSDMQTELLALRGQKRRAVEPKGQGEVLKKKMTDKYCPQGEIKKLEIELFIGMLIVHSRTEGIVGLTRWIVKASESVSNISGCAIENQEVLKKKMTDKYCPHSEIKKLEIKLWNLKVDKYISGLPDNIYENVKSSRPKTLDETIELANDLMDQKLRTYVKRSFISSAFSSLIDIAQTPLENSYDVELADGKIVGAQRVTWRKAVRSFWQQISRKKEEGTSREGKQLKEYKHQRTKHIEIDIHFVCDLVAAGQVRVLHVPSCCQFADIFTKGLPSALFEEFHSSLSVRSPPTLTAGEC